MSSLSRNMAYRRDHLDSDPAWSQVSRRPLLVPHPTVCNMTLLTDQFLGSWVEVEEVIIGIDWAVVRTALASVTACGL